MYDPSRAVALPNAYAAMIRNHSKSLAWKALRRHGAAADALMDLLRHVDADSDQGRPSPMGEADGTVNNEIEREATRRRAAGAVPLADEEVQALISAMPDRLRAIVILAAGTGLRLGECFGLTVDRVDFDRRTLRVDQQLMPHRGAPSQQSPLQPLRSQRTVPVSAAVLDALEAHLETYGSGRWNLIFTDDQGGPISMSRFSNTWRRAVKDAGLPVGTRFHQLRHYCAAVLIRSGSSVKLLQKWLGHLSARATLDTYGHLFPDTDDQTPSWRRP